MCTHTSTDNMHTHFNGQFPGQPGKSVPERQTVLYFDATSDDGEDGGANRNSSVQIICHHQYQQFFYRLDALPVTKPTVLKH